MPFGLANALATFQELMSQIFHVYLRKFILDFFDDILVYRSSLETNWGHLDLTLAILRQHTLSAKLLKCSFAQPQLEYLGHIMPSTRSSPTLQ